MNRDEFLDILFNVAAELAEEGVADDEIAISCRRICAAIGINLDRVLN
jgi:hypothetical protein